MNYKDRVYEKMSAEYDRFIESMKQLSGEEAISNSYEKVFKEDILMCFEESDMSISTKQAKALLAEKNPLDYLYQEWLSSDYSYLDVLRDNISDSLNFLEKQWQKHRSQAR